jgi:2-phospho-L-lactate guanylyltransferase
VAGVAVIPIKSFRHGNTRLSPVLGEEQRRVLARSLSEHVSTTLARASLDVLVVTADDEVLEWAAKAGFDSVQDPGLGLDHAAAAGVASLGDVRWMVIHSDLPLLSSTDARRLSGALAEGRPALAPSADGGTSAIISTGRLGFSYGPGSFRRHLSALPDADVIALSGLLHDLDKPEDLESALRHPRGLWLREALS